MKSARKLTQLTRTTKKKSSNTLDLSFLAMEVVVGATYVPIMHWSRLRMKASLP
jgi:hypothetical protein